MRTLFPLAALALALSLTAVGAQTPPPNPSREAYDRAFRDQLARPGDPATLLRFAEVAIQVGDLEGAISALERLLLIDGDQPRVKLELGVLYFRLGSHEAARSYLESARASARATQEIKDRATTFLAEVDSATQRSRWSGDGIFGLRYSSNANSGSVGAIQSFGTAVIPSPSVSRRQDWSALLGANLRHRYDLGRQDDSVLDTALAVFGSRQFQVSAANVALLDLETGPRFGLFADTIDDFTVRPYLNTRFVMVNDYSSYIGYGAGLEFAKKFGDGLSGSFGVLGRRREFTRNPDAPTNDNSSGTDANVNGELRMEVASWLTLSVQGSGSRYTASVGSESYWEYSFGGSAEFGFTDPIGINGRLWSLTLAADHQAAYYDAPDSSVNTLINRVQHDFNASATLAIPLDATVTLVGQVTYTDRRASLSNFSYDALTMLTGIAWRF